MAVAAATAETDHQLGVADADPVLGRSVGERLCGDGLSLPAELAKQDSVGEERRGHGCSDGHGKVFLILDWNEARFSDYNQNKKDTQNITGCLWCE